MLSYRQTMDFSDLVQACKAGVRNHAELMTFLNVTEDALQGVAMHYKKRYGPCLEIDNYIIYFAPLGVLEKNF